MESTLEPWSLREVVIILCAAGVVVPVFYRLRISSVLGFILIGMAVGPFGLGALAADWPWLSYMTITNRAAIESVAEFGVMLLLFMIGLELSFERLMTMRRMIFGFGLLQVVLTTLALVGIALAFGQSMTASIVLGLGLSLSSTAIIIQVLAEKKLINSGVGRTTFAVLLFQDVAVVPILFAVGVLASGDTSALAGKFSVAVLQAVVTIVALIILGRRVLRPLFRMVAETKSSELFMAACLLVVLASSLVTHFAGMSTAMGALLAGLLLAETEYRRQIEVTIEPFKGLLLGVFLISIGLSADLGLLIRYPLAVLGGVIGLVGLKALIVAGLGRFFSVPVTTGLRSGLLLGSGSEFTFVILGLALSYGLVDRATGNFVLLLAVLTMTLIPVMEWLGRVASDRATVGQPSLPEEALEQVPQDEAPRVIIAGFGRVGDMVASLLEAHTISYLAIDFDANLVAEMRRKGRPVYYGDITRIDFLRHCGLENASALVITMDNPHAVEAVARLARAERADLLIVARARDAGHAAHLYRVGVTDAVPETVEASLQLSETLLVDLGVPMGRVIASVHERRAALRAEIQTLAPDAEVRPNFRRRLSDFERANR